MQNDPGSFPEVPPPPPELNRRMLWLSLLLPPAIAMVFMALFNLFPDLVHNKRDDLVLTAFCAIACLAILGGLIAYTICLSRRFRGTSLVLLIIGYPILQGAMALTIFFVGCIAFITREGGI